MVWVWDNNFSYSSFVHEKKVRRKKDSLDMVQPWRVNFRAS
jgi:hypothetical protein